MREYGQGIKIGIPIEIHPGCNLWMRGAKYGTVKTLTLDGLTAKVKMDHPALPNLISFPIDRLKPIS